MKRREELREVTAFFLPGTVCSPFKTSEKLCFVTEGEGRGPVSLAEGRANKQINRRREKERMRQRSKKACRHARRGGGGALEAKETLDLSLSTRKKRGPKTGPTLSEGATPREEMTEVSPSNDRARAGRKEKKDVQEVCKKEKFSEMHAENEKKPDALRLWRRVRKRLRLEKEGRSLLASAK